MPRDEPQRTCVACREARDKEELIRFVLDPDRNVVPDILGKLPGRGAYACTRQRCVLTAVAKRQFARSFRGEVRCAPGEDIVRQVAALFEERLASYLSLANKAGKVVSGSDMVMEALRRPKKPGVVLIASDISTDIGAKVVFLAERAGVDHYILFDKDRIGALIGKGARSVVAVGASGFVEVIRKEMQRYRSFLEEGVQ